MSTTGATGATTGQTAVTEAQAQEAVEQTLDDSSARVNEQTSLLDFEGTVEQTELTFKAQRFSNQLQLLVNLNTMMEQLMAKIIQKLSVPQ